MPLLPEGIQILDTDHVAAHNTLHAQHNVYSFRYFASAAARDAEITAPVEGMHAYLADTNTITFYDGAAWANAIPAGVGNMWKISKTASQTLTASTLNTITFDRTDIDGGSSVVDLANNRFVAPATGFYMAFVTWLWETTAPNAASAYMQVIVNGSAGPSILRLQVAPTANGGNSGSSPLSLTSGDFVTLGIDPSAATGATARGNAGTHLSTSLTLVRIT